MPEVWREDVHHQLVSPPLVERDTVVVKEKLVTFLQKPHTCLHQLYSKILEVRKDKYEESSHFKQLYDKYKSEVE